MRIGSRCVRLGESLVPVLSLVTLLGCGGGGGGSASGTFSWGVYDIGDTSFRTPLNCSSVGAGDVVLSLQNANTGQTFTNVGGGRCRDGLATTTTVPPGDYYVGFDLYGDPAVYGNNNTLLDSFDTKDVFRLYAGSDTDYTTTPEPFFVASFIVRWNIYSASQGGFAGCAPGDEVDFEFLTPGTTTWVTSTFPCNQGGTASYAGAGTSYPFPVGVASAQWQMFLVDAGGNTVAAVPATAVGLPQNADVDLGAQTFNAP